MPVEPWSAFPPEVNASRLLSGGGIATWEAMAAEWAAMAAVVNAEMVSLGGASLVMGEGWSSAGGMSTVSSLAPFRPWLVEMGAVAVKNAAACQAVVTSYVAAVASMIPAGAVAVNRASATVAQAAEAASSAAAAVPGVVGAFSAAKNIQDKTMVAELESQYAGMWEANAVAMTDYDVAVTNATKSILPPPPPPPVSKDLGLSALSSLRPAQLGQGKMEQAFARQMAPGTNPLQQVASGAQQVATGAQQAATGAQSAALPAQQAAMGQQAGMGQNYGQYGYGQGQHARTMSDAEFRKMLGGLSSGRGGLRSFPRMSSGGGLHGGGAVASGLGGTGTQPGSLGLRAGSSAAVPAAVFSGVPTVAPPPQSPMGGSPMMSPLGGARGIKSGSEDHASATRVLDQDSWLDKLMPYQAQTTTGQLLAESGRSGVSSEASGAEGEQQRTTAE